MNVESTMTPEQRARHDYQTEGLGQDSNPYDRHLQPVEWGRYGWEMHKIWAENFHADQQLAHSIRNGNERS